MSWKSLGPIGINGKHTPPCVFPLNDLREHDHDNTECWCKPFFDDGILVHNAMDGWEKYERGERLAS